MIYTGLLKIKRNQLDRSESAFALSLRGIKVFKIFKKADFSYKIEIDDFRSPITYKMDRLSSGPHRAQLSQFPSGDKRKSNLRKKTLMFYVFFFFLLKWGHIGKYPGNPSTSNRGGNVLVCVLYSFLLFFFHRVKDLKKKRNQTFKI